MIDRIEHFFREWRRRLSRSEWAIRFLRLPVSEGTANEPGVLLIQIDGFARRQLEHALARGRLPFLTQLIQRDHYGLHTFYSGLPSTTPAVQAELHYGTKCAVPAFSFMDNDSRSIRSMLNAAFAKTVEERLAKNGEGLLKGGSSWSNIYTGGAAMEESHFCSASMGLWDMLKSQPILNLLFFPILHFVSFLRILFLLPVEFCVAVSDMIHGVYRGESLYWELRMVVMRVLICVGLRELITIGVKVDVARGLPVIHCNFVGYDDQAHRRGPSSEFAHWSLRGIDRAIKKIHHAAQRSSRRDYQVWIFSDHGQETVEPFENIAGAPLEDIVQRILDGLGNEISTVPKIKDGKSTRRRKRESRRGRSWVRRVHIDYDFPPDEPFIAAAMGPIGHLYLPKGCPSVVREELAKRLVGDGHVPGVLICKAGGEVEWMHASGTHRLPEEALDLLPHPPEIRGAVAADLAALCKQEFAGDLVLLGWTPDADQRVSFVIERGAHCGPGPEETQGFALLPARTRLPASAGEFIRPGELRDAALHLLGRKTLPAAAKKLRAPSEQLRVMTYNVHSCRGMDGRISAERIARVIAEYEPDIVALQELDLGRLRSQRHDQPRLIAEALGMHLAFCPTVVADAEQYGHALLSRYPLEIIRTQILCEGRRFGNAETRGALWVRIAFGDVRLNVMNTHFGLYARERHAQLDDLLGENWIGALDENEPLILCGDFNMLPRGRTFRALSGRLHDVQRGASELPPQKTFSTFHPFARIDHIFVSRHFTPGTVLVPRTSLTRVASDHLPVIADLAMKTNMAGRTGTKEALGSIGR